MYRGGLSSTGKIRTCSASCVSLSQIYQAMLGLEDCRKEARSSKLFFYVGENIYQVNILELLSDV